ncbi:MAG: hypothetical protein ACJ8CB_08195 [Ktedonobacteraceae bacterium]
MILVTFGYSDLDVDYLMNTFPIVKRKDEKQYGAYRTKRVILEIYDEMKRAMEPGPADPSVTHGPRERVDMHI